MAAKETVSSILAKKAEEARRERERNPGPRRGGTGKAN